MEAGQDAPRRRSYRGRTPEQRDAERREQLRAAALDLFGTRGWNGTSIEELCRRARVTTRHFYALYGGREEVFLDLYDTLVEGLLAQLGEAVLAAPPDDLEAQLRAGLQAMVRAYARDERLARVVLVEVLGISRRVEEHRRKAIDRFAETAAAALAASALVDEPARAHVVGVALVGAVTELLVHRMARDDGPPDDLIVDELVRLFATRG